MRPNNTFELTVRDVSAKDSQLGVDILYGFAYCTACAAFIGIAIVLIAVCQVGKQLEHQN